MDTPDILLINLNQSDSESDVMRLPGDHFRFAYVSDTDAIPETLRSLTPILICFEYDYPDIPRLAALQQTKLAYPAFPIVMVTRQHSEDLAVWAFRSRVWDYFTKPLPVTEVLECFSAIQTLPRKQQRQVPRKFAMRECALPADTRFQASPRSRELKIISTAITQVERNLHSKISQSEIAASCGLSSSQFSRVFKQVHGTTFQEYVMQRRMSQAIRLLQNPGASVTDVCYTVGFNDQSHFTRIFRRYLGVSPSAYRNSLENAHDSLLPQAVNY